MQYTPFLPNPGYNWWFGASGGSSSASHYAALSNKQADTKNARVAYTNASLLVRDRLVKEHNSQSVLELLDSCRVKLFDFSMDGEFAAILEAMGIKPEVIKPFEAPMVLMQGKLDPSHFVVISGLYVPQPQQMLQPFLNFMNDGGRLIILNSAAPLVATLFMGKIVPAIQSTTVRAPIHIGGERELFTGFEPLDDIDLEFSRQPIDVVDKKEVKILAKIHSWREEPMLVKATYGNGLAYILISKLWATPKKVDNITEWLNKKGASPVTLTAWECLQKLGLKEGLSMAVSVLGSIEMFAKIFVKEQQTLKSLFPAQEQEQQPETHNQEENNNGNNNHTEGSHQQQQQDEQQHQQQEQGHEAQSNGTHHEESTEMMSEQ